MLTRAGLSLVTRNFQSRFGEIDLVMRDGSTLVFVEVRFRRARGRVSAAESVGPHKQRRLVRAASFFLMRHPQFRDLAVRFDVAACATDAAGNERIDWIRDAFRC